MLSLFETMNPLNNVRRMIIVEQAMDINQYEEATA